MARDTQYVIGRDWKSYREANSRFPNVRQNEVGHMLNLVSPQLEETMLEVGTGNGVLTFPLAMSVGKTGRVVTYDATAENISAVQKQNRSLDLSIDAKIQKLDYTLDESDEEVDTVVSLAAFHHYDSNGENNTGVKGRLRALREFSRVLKSGGKLIIGDVSAGTCSSKYFDSINTPIFCPGGHPHEFLDSAGAYVLLQQAGLQLKKFEVRKVPWTFQSKDEAGSFIKMIHGSLCSKEESLEHAKTKLRFWQEKGCWRLEWELFYLVAVKK